MLRRTVPGIVATQEVAPGRADAAGARALFVGSPLSRRPSFGNLHPLAIPRVAAVMDLCAALGWLADSELRESPQAGVDTLAEFHRRDYIAALSHADAVQAVDAPTRERYRLGNFENPVFPGVYRRAAATVGGSILAAELALDGPVAFHPAGGTHHGRPDRASGFCYFNDPVFALRTLERHGLERIVYVDLDAHHCDGVQDAFHDDGRVATISIHEEGRWPGTGALGDRGGGRSLNLPVPAGLHDEELRFLMDELVLPAAQAFRPEAVVVTCGTDALAGDPLAKLALSNLGLWDAVDRLCDLAPVRVVLGGGGYNPWTLARCWTGLWGRIRGESLPATLPAAARAVLEEMTCDLVDDDEILTAWTTTLADEPRHGRVRPEIKALALRMRSP